MMTEKRQVRKGVSSLVFTFVSFLFLFSHCMSVDDKVSTTIPQLSFFDEGEIEFEQEGGSQTFELKSNVDWSLSKNVDAKWINVSPTSGKEGTTTLTVKVQLNNGVARKGCFKIATSTMEKTITIAQDGADIPEIEYTTIDEIRSLYDDYGKEKWRIAESLNLKGVVISDREGGNRSSQRDGFIQDEAGDGLAFRVTQPIHTFDMGDQLSINLKDATVLIFGGMLQLNFSDKATSVLAQNVMVDPRELTIEEILHGSHDGTLVRIDDVQFETYKDLYYYDKGNATNHILENCNEDNIIVRVTKNASFKYEPLPAGMGSMVGIASLNDGEWQLLIRNLDDTDEINNDESTRCSIEEPAVEATRITVAEFRAAIADGATYTEESYLEGEVILNPCKGNVPDNVVYLADETAGVVLTFSDTENILTRVPMSAKVKVNVKGTKAKVVGGLLQIGNDNTLATYVVEIIEKTPARPLQPKVASMGAILAGKYQSELVRIENVQFKDIEANYVNVNFVTNEATQELEVYTRREATFANDAVKKGMGSIVAVVSIYNSPQLVIRSLDDLAGMNGERFGDSSSSSSFIVVDKTTIVFDNKGGDETININANVDWTANTDKTWLTITPKSGSNNGAITVTATENDGEERKSAITITDGAITKTVYVTQKAKTPIKSVAKDLFFSEYIKGTSYNKYIEIYNGTGVTVDLSDYKIELYVNGQIKAKSTEFLFGTLENGKVLVFGDSKAVIYDGEAITSSAMNFNGNDAMALVKISTGTFVDIIGSIGHDPGRKGWVSLDNEDLTTFGRTLVRKSSVRGGVTVNPSDEFPTLGAEWISHPVNTIDYLGWHTMD